MMEIQLLLLLSLFVALSLFLNLLLLDPERLLVLGQEQLMKLVLLLL